MAEREQIALGEVSVTDKVKIYKDVGDSAGTVILEAVDTAGEGTATLKLTTEQAVEAVGTFTASNKIKVSINGTEYWIQLDAV